MKGFVGVPVAAILSEKDNWGYEEFLAAATDVMGATVIEYRKRDGIDAVVLKYEQRRPEIWVNAHARGYTELFRKFCMDILGIFPDTSSLSQRDFAVDHAYCKSAVPNKVTGFIRMFLVPHKVNSSWGGYFEKKLKDPLSRMHQVGVRNETVAIRAKISGLAAPSLGQRSHAEKSASVAKVVDELIKMGMLEEASRANQIQSLQAFCNIADGAASGVITRMTLVADGDMKVETANLVRHDDQERQL